MKRSILLLALTMMAFTLSAAPKKLLMVTTTTGFRHSSIPNLEKVVAQMGKDSGSFTVDFVRQPANHPGGLKADATEQDKSAHAAALAKWDAALKEELKKLSADSLKQYDGVVFASTTGDLPIPDLQALLDWIKQGHAFIGIHAASDTFHKSPAFAEMLGGEFDHHGPQVGVECVNVDPEHPANAKLGKTWAIAQEEIYEFRNYDPAKVHDLLILDKSPQTKAPGHFPVTWGKKYGAGRVFYTSLGHREDLIDTDPALRGRKNNTETSKSFQDHVLGGIEWALAVKK